MDHKQRERRQRGHDFQEEIRRSWRLIPKTWQLTIKDGGGGSRPADKLVLCEGANLLQELKRTNKGSFQLDFLRPNQVQGLVDFDQVISRNYGLVGVSFSTKDLDEAYFFRLVHALVFMKDNDRLHIKRQELADGIIPRIVVPRTNDTEPTYDLRGVAECYKYL